jgi:hypothetical protein
MKRILLLTGAIFLAGLFLGSAALAQGTTVVDAIAVTTQGPLAPTGGGPAMLLPAAALLLGSGVLTYAILRRRG